MIDGRVLLIGMLLIGTIGTMAAPGLADEGNGANEGGEIVHSETIQTERGFQITADFYSNMTLEVSSLNLNRQTREASFALQVVRTTIRHVGEDLQPGETGYWTFDLAVMQDPSEHQQTVKVGTFGPTIQHTYNATPTAADADDMPLPQITNVDLVANGTAADPRTELHVTVENPTPHAHRQHVVVSTEETGNAVGRPEARPNETGTAVIELNEPPDAVVRGEVRLYTNDYSDMNDSLDMVEFAGEPEGNLTVKNRTYEPIHPNYHYEPSGTGSDDDDGVGVPGGGSLSGDALLAAGFLGAGTLAIGCILAVGARRRY
ncbi:hypothetical protein [Haloparvum sedimenti]|uniref:hypothetical protein n=1 Tax=Haloparvum sedimenti TaxID=1678448 RepID=UPI00071E7D2B|nr:hypothetical protein [Haloparvum sedimenti]